MIEGLYLIRKPINTILYSIVINLYISVTISIIRPFV